MLKYLNLHYITLLFLALLSSGCLSTITPTTIPTLTAPPYNRKEYIVNENIEQPEFIVDATNGVGGIEGYYLLCVTIHHWPLWHSGDDATAIHRMIQKSVIIWIDGQPASIVVQDVTMSAEFTRGDGSIGITDVCARVIDSSVGFHTAKIEFQNLHNEMFSYEWVFEITG